MRKQAETTETVSDVPATSALKPGEWFLERWLESPVSYVSDALEVIHLGLGLPWYATIGLTAAAVRLFIAPTLLWNIKQISTMMDTTPIVKLIHSEWKRKKMNSEFANAQEERAFVRKMYREVTDISGFRIWKILGYPICLVGCLMPFIFASRQILRRPNHDLDQGGLLWFLDLSQPDMHTVLPFVAVSLSIMVVQYRGGRRLYIDEAVKQQLPFPTLYQWLFRFYYLLQCYYVLNLPLMADMPAGIFCYWIPFSLIGLLSKGLLFNPKFRKLMGLQTQLARSSEPFDPKLNKYFHQLSRQFSRVHLKSTPLPPKPKKQLKQLASPKNSPKKL
ncbi:hypothetical protein RFI_07066 [Reticulomyxa filosa]|uniref:Uncharacterized protein n=1 Tax=Reticulomyxa filosa TaxID=46433 RepID=X6NVY8_RETFI|nr:hypothetical protein RFI_07066 [Reticulomyxa filosa]|eukprot:ETO30053.1 hypothetical protein RFI_07066 [Reticulomyxa filosa]